MGHHRGRVCVTDSCFNYSIRFNRWKINTCASLKVKINTCTSLKVKINTCASLKVKINTCASLKVKRSYIEKPLTRNTVEPV
jgi:hypothetical protein